jgi:hypothetical protein
MEIYDIEKEAVVKLTEEEERKFLTRKGFILIQMENDATIYKLWKWIDNLIAENLIALRS